MDFFNAAAPFIDNNYHNPSSLRLILTTAARHEPYRKGSGAGVNMLYA
jgi:hypothetical protein